MLVCSLLGCTCVLQILKVNSLVTERKTKDLILIKSCVGWLFPPIWTLDPSTGASRGSRGRRMSFIWIRRISRISISSSEWRAYICDVCANNVSLVPYILSRCVDCCVEFCDVTSPSLPHMTRAAITVLERCSVWGFISNGEISSDLLKHSTHTTSVSSSALVHWLLRFWYFLRASLTISTESEYSHFVFLSTLFFSSSLSFNLSWFDLENNGK